MHQGRDWGSVRQQEGGRGYDRVRAGRKHGPPYARVEASSSPSCTATEQVCVTSFVVTQDVRSEELKIPDMNEVITSFPNKGALRYVSPGNVKHVPSRASVILSRVTNTFPIPITDPSPKGRRLFCQQDSKPHLPLPPPLQPSSSALSLPGASVAVPALGVLSLSPEQGPPSPAPPPAHASSTTADAADGGA